MYMQMTKKYWVGIGVGAAILVLAGLAYYLKPTVTLTPGNAPIVATSTGSTSTSTQPVATSSVQAFIPFPINKADTITSWNFKGAYAGNALLTTQAQADITNLTNLLAAGKFDAYNVYNAIANDYSSLGKGALAYQYYNRSIRLYPNIGLAYANLGHFMDSMGAYYTAADAYAKATTVEPGMLEYHLERLTYLTRQFPKDNARIVAAITDASKQFGDNASILSIEAQWLAGQGRYADAIKAWQTVKTLSPGKDTTAIDAEIARLQAKQ